MLLQFPGCCQTSPCLAWRFFPPLQYRIFTHIEPLYPQSEPKGAYLCVLLRSTLPIFEFVIRSQCNGGTETHSDEQNLTVWRRWRQLGLISSTRRGCKYADVTGGITCLTRGNKNNTADFQTVTVTQWDAHTLRRRANGTTCEPSPKLRMPLTHNDAADTYGDSPGDSRVKTDLIESTSSTTESF